LTHYEFLSKLVIQLVCEYRELYKKTGRPPCPCSQFVTAKLVERHFPDTIPDNKRKMSVVCASAVG